MVLNTKRWPLEMDDECHRGVGACPVDAHGGDTVHACGLRQWRDWRGAITVLTEVVLFIAALRLMPAGLSMRHDQLCRQVSRGRPRDGGRRLASTRSADRGADCPRWADVRPRNPRARPNQLTTSGRFARSGGGARRPPYRPDGTAPEKLARLSQTIAQPFCQDCHIRLLEYPEVAARNGVDRDSLAGQSAPPHHRVMRAPERLLARPGTVIWPGYGEGVYVVSARYCAAMTSR